MSENNALQADVSRGLFWVKGELTQCLQRVRCHIESYLESPDEDTQALDGSLQDVRQLASIASVIQCYSVHLLAEEMLASLRHLQADVGNKSDAGFGALVSATLQLVDYVELLAHGENDHPLVFAPAINELRVSRGEAICPRAQLFQRYLDVRGLDVPPPPSDHRKPGMSRALAGKHAAVIQKAVLGAIRNENRERALQVLVKATAQLGSVAIDPRVYQCWRGVEAMCLVLAVDPDAATPEVQKLLAKVAQCVKALAGNGEAPIARAAAALGAQCLHVLSLSEVQTPALEGIRTEFGFAAENLSESHLEELRSSLAQPNIESLQTVTREIRHALHDIKDTIDLALRSGGQVGAGEGLANSLNTVGSTLSVLGLDALGQLAQQQGKRITAIADGGSDDDWLQVAETLIRIEQGLDAELLPSRRSVVVGQAGHQDLREGVGAVLRESLVNVTRIKTELDHFMARGQADALAAARKLLAEISSAFDLLGMSDAVEVLGLVGDKLVPECVEVARTRALVADRIADMIAGIEYFIEAVQEHQPHTGRLLADVRRYLQQLDEVLLAAEPETLAEAPAEAPADDAVDPEFREIFIEESREVLAGLQAVLPRWSQNPANPELLGEVRRGFHTLKGSGRMVGAQELGEFAWAVEDLLNRCRDGALALDSQVSELVENSVGLLPDLIAGFERGEPSGNQAEDLLGRIRGLLDEGEEVEAEAEVLQVFLEDAEAYLEELQQQIDQPAVGEALVRLLHSLRGGAAAVGLEPISQLAAAAESLTQTLRGLNHPLEDGLLAQLHATFSAQLAAVRAGKAPEMATELEAGLSAKVQHLLESSDGVDLELAGIFAEEALDLLEQAESELRNWSNRPESDEAERNLQRIFHTIKGSARTAGAMGLGQVGEALDSLMKAVLAGEFKPVDQALFARIGQCLEGSYNLLDEFREGRDVDPAAVLAILGGEAAVMPAQPMAAAAPEPEPEPDVVVAAEPAAEAAVAEEDFTVLAEDVWPPDAEILDMFMGEAQELLESMDQNFASWEMDHAALEPLRSLQRDLHTFKGGARMCGLNSLGAIAHEMETSFAALEQGRQLDSGIFGRLHHAIDGLHHLLDGVKAGHPPSGAFELLADLRGEGEAGDVAPAPAVSVAEQPSVAELPEALDLDPADAGLDEAPAADLQPEPVAAADDELVEIFLPEAAELMEAFDAARPLLAAGPEQAEDARADILRVLHTLKGGARMAGLAELGDAVHALESRLERLVAEPEAGDAQALPGQLEAASDHFHALLQQAGLGPQAPTAVEEPTPAGPEPAQPVPTVATRSWSDALTWDAGTDDRLAAIRRETARVSVEQLDTMLNEAGEISIYRSRLERQVNGISGHLREVEQTIVRIRDQLRALETETDAQIQARTQGLQTSDDADRYDAEFDPLEMDRYSRMQELTRALSESVTDLSSLHNSMTDLVSETDTLLLQQGRVNTSVQQGLMSTLMVPFSRQVQRLQRVLRQTAGDNGKQVELVFSGIEAEMDRNVLERMTPVIEHVIRNCVIHGLEKPQDRVAAGKPASGKVAIALSRDGSKLAIEIRDNGRGLDFKRIRAKALEKGLMTPDAQLSEAEMAQFIFQPGFSTAESLTQDAGRGVGMDVVSAEVKQLGGTLELDSRIGEGARFVIRLPLSLAIAQALMVQVGDEVYATPLANIEGIARLPASELSRFLDDQQSFEYGGHAYRVRYLGQLLGMDTHLPDERAYVPVILVHTGEGMGISERRVAVAVDQLLGSRELVTKTAGPQVSTVVGVTGATIQSDGRVVLILDVVALVQDRLFKTLQHVVAGDAVASARTELPLVMVIDDSITMRRVAERVLTRNGYRVATAKDGMDGIAQLQSETPDAVLLDIEMPKVDGFEVATFIRNNERLARVPIIMITSRSGDKHRERAQAIGVNRYLIKPYQEQQLINELHAVMSTEA